MTAVLPNTPKALITLLPEARALSTFPNLSWDDVRFALRSFGPALAAAIPDPDLHHGYRVLALELAERIESHPNRKEGWV
jgi:hypothetical protein